MVVLKAGSNGIIFFSQGFEGFISRTEVNRISFEGRLDTDNVRFESPLQTQWYQRMYYY